MPAHCRHHLVFVVAVALATAGCEDQGAPVEPVPASEGGTASTLDGRYRVELRPAQAKVPLGTIHEWIAQVSREDGGAVEGVTITFDGGMPSHDHGFTTAPRVVTDAAPGRFRVQGVRFHMSGAWELRVDVRDATGSDRAVFQVEVAP